MNKAMGEVKKCPSGKHLFVPADIKIYNGNNLAMTFLCQKCLYMIDKQQVEIANNSYKESEKSEELV